MSLEITLQIPGNLLQARVKQFLFTSKRDVRQLALSPRGAEDPSVPQPQGQRHYLELLPVAEAGDSHQSCPGWFGMGQMVLVLTGLRDSPASSREISELNLAHEH